MQHVNERDSCSYPSAVSFCGDGYDVVASPCLLLSGCCVVICVTEYEIKVYRSLQSLSDSGFLFRI